MSEIARLVQDISGSSNLRERLLKQQGGFESSLAAAREAGYAITTEEAVTYLNSLRDDGHKPLCDTQLDTAAGGGKSAPSWFPKNR